MTAHQLIEPELSFELRWKLCVAELSASRARWPAVVDPQLTVSHADSTSVTRHSLFGERRRPGGRRTAVRGSWIAIIVGDLLDALRGFSAERHFMIASGYAEVHLTRTAFAFQALPRRTSTSQCRPRARRWAGPRNDTDDVQCVLADAGTVDADGATVLRGTPRDAGACAPAK
jgi:hypothetical protein